ncbi:MAG: chromate transporter [Clostridia bacterium]
MTLLKIFLTYFKIGCMAFGGGYVMLPLIENEFVKKQQIIETEEVYKLFALAQSLPGIVAVNMAVFLGHRLAKTKGAVSAAVGVMLPSIIIITVIAAFFGRFAEIPAVQSVFRGLNIAVLAIIAQALWKMMKTGLKDKITIGIFLAVFLGYVITGFNPVLFTIAGALAGFLLAGRGEKHA